ncbi:uncharacterized protein ARMOST_19407 [Armillaria ostoyae]|uniref:Uncharacterized protein n=1 Tax=Armillaria ostoyae TaxID=47428 RepID=A0A284S4G9_ARMOS|nr:uncharacterized protein ARMOST_19407 [Armillaria ostoyae]
MKKVFLSVLDGSVQNEVIECMQSVLDFIYYAHFEEHTDESLSKLDEAWHTFHDKKAVFIDLDIRQHFNIPKVYSTIHYASIIWSHGTADSFNTEASKHLHIDFTKVAYNTSNKKDYVKQMTMWLRRQEVVDNFDRFLDWAVEEYDELEDDEVEGDNDDEDDVEAMGTEAEAVPASQANVPVISAVTANNESSESDIVRATDTLQYGESTYSVLKFPSFKNVDLDTLDKKYGVTKFVYTLKSFFHHHGMYHPDFWDAWPAKYEVFKQC